MTRRHYTEHIFPRFNEEIQSTHFGQGVTLSIEGYFLEFKTSSGTVKAQVHPHMSDKSKQDTACTHARLIVLVEILIEPKMILPGKSTIWDDTDKYNKQYRCAKDLYLLSALETQFDITIDRMVDTPRHGKDVVDGINEQDKVYLRKEMITTDVRD